MKKVAPRQAAQMSKRKNRLLSSTPFLRCKMKTALTVVLATLGLLVLPSAAQPAVAVDVAQGTPPGKSEDGRWQKAEEYFNIGRLREAAELYDELGSSTPSVAHRLEAVRALIATGLPYAAHEIARQGASDPSDDPQAEMARILTAQKLGDVAESAARLKALIARPEPRSPYLAYLIARHLLLQDQPAQVRSLWPQLREAGPLYPEAYVAVYESADALGLATEAAQSAAAFLEHAPASEEKSAAWFREKQAFRKKFPAPFLHQADGVVRLPLQMEPLPIVEMQATDGSTLKLVVDTGADALYLDETTARRLKLDLGVSASEIQTFSATTSGYLTVLPKLSAHGLRLESITTLTINWRSKVAEMRAAVLKRTDRPPGSEAALDALLQTDGLISASLLAGDGILWFDVVGKSLVVAPDAAQAGMPEKVFRGPLFGCKRPWVPVVISGKAPILALIDTGHNKALSLDEAYQKFAGIRGEPVEPSGGLTLNASGVSQSNHRQLAIRLNLWAADGPEFNMLPATLTKLNPGDLHNLATSAVLGWDLWKDFSPALDFKKGELLLIPPADPTGNSPKDKAEKRP